MSYASRSARWTALAVLLLNGCASVPWHRTERQILWEVRDSRHVVYLMGAVHVMPKSVYPLDRRMEQAFTEAEEVVLEIDLSQRTDEDVAREVEQLGRYPRGESLSEHLTPAAKAYLREALPAFGLTLESVSDFQPWFLADVLTSQYFYEAGLRPEYGVDNHFLGRAKKERKRISGLEEVKAQAAINRGDNDAEGEAHLLNSLTMLEPVARTVHGMAVAWRQGDLDALTSLIELQAEADPKMHERMFLERNRAWLPAIERHLRGKQDALIIVGAGHLIGSHGLVQMLRERGYAVRQL